MKSSGSPAAGPRRRAAPVLIPIAVCAAIVGVVAWSAWPIIRPAREVIVVQAVFDRSSSTEIESDGPTVRDTPTVQAPGWLEAEPYLVACTALTDGVVESIDVLEGDYVEKDQVVARLVAIDSELRLRRAEADLAESQAAAAEARAESEYAERSWDNPVELERSVASRRAALDEGMAELAQLPSLIDAARATLVRLEEEADRVLRSVEKNAASEFEAVAAQQYAATQLAEVGALTARRPILAARIERYRSELRAAERDLALRIEDRRELDSAHAGVLRADASVSRASALRDEAALELERMTVRAPISGYVQRRLKTPGDKVVRMMDSPHSAHLVHLYDPSRLQVRVDVPLVDAAHVSVGQSCEVIVEVLPDRVFRGEVLRVTHEADLQKNTLQVKVGVIDPDPILKPEMLTRVKFLSRRGGDNSASARTQESGEDGQRVLIPASVIVGDADSSRVWIVSERRHGRGVLASRNVRVIDQSGAWRTVVGAVRPGDLIATGLADPQEGERVVIGEQPTPEKENPS